ncbi:MAG: beta/gamma crystallin domain-containing protein [Gammaproteobacteria bacterium]
MNKTPSLPLGIGVLALAFLVTLGFSGPAQAFTAGCWADFYEFSNYVGPVIRIEGPAELESLRNVQGSNWESKIDSMVVGPKARVWLYENPNFKLTLSEMANYPELMKALGITQEEVHKESELTFNPKESIHHLGEFNFHKKAKSIKVECTE